jgi:two-component system, OmpR family, sensor histidine kinase KdpD
LIKPKHNLTIQYSGSIGLVLLLSLLCFLGTPFIGYKVVAYMLLLAVSILAMLFDILPVLVAAILSALIWNFFFIPPIFTFHIDHTEDMLLFLMYFAVAMVNAVLTSRIRKGEQKIRDREEKEKTIKLYNTLLNSLSHELRTPIATIVGAIDTLKDPNTALSLQHQKQLLEEMDIASTRLNGQVENLLHMSRLETGILQLKKDWCDVQELVHLTLNKFDEAQMQRIIFEQQEDLPLFKLDAGLMEQVLYNLIHNTFQHTPDNTVITIVIAYQENLLQIWVRDNGQGFPDNEIDQVFDKFYRLKSSKAGGTGLGLSIVKGFVEAHNGSISLRNIQAHGAEFFIQIPCELSHIANLHHE